MILIIFYLFIELSITYTIKIDKFLPIVLDFILLSIDYFFEIFFFIQDINLVDRNERKKKERY